MTPSEIERLWPRFLMSDEFRVLSWYEQRVCSFVRAVSAYPLRLQQHPTAVLQCWTDFVARYVYVDDPTAFARCFETWLRWLKRIHHPSMQTNVDLSDARREIEDAAHSAGNASKSLAREAISLGLDLHDTENVIRVLSARYDVDYLREFLDPPYPILLNGEALHIGPEDLVSSN